ncbi:MAG: hypothetical protein RJB13_1779, partial [Pseudomonadota bacterium]
MDMRLLWAWSNHFDSYKQTGVFTVLIYLHLFFLALGASGLAEGSVIAGKVPASTLVELQWSSSIHGFEGAQYLVLPRTHLKDLKLNPTNHITQDVDLDFWILPNRDLHPSRQLALTREQLEFSQANVTVEWPLSEIGLGAVTVRQVDVSDSDDLCSGREASTLTWDKHSQWSTASIERRNFEQSLRVNISPKKESRCVALRIFFQFFPRDGIGNFAMQRRSGGTLSGPVHLLLKSGPLPTKVRFRDRSKQLKMSCLRCTEGKEGWTEVAYEGLPPVLEFSSVDTPEDTLSFEGSSIFKLESETHSAKLKEMANDVEESVKLFQPAVTKLFAESGTVWRFRLKPEILIEQLLIGQPSDIQMGPAYGEFGLFLDSFQQAALFREIARNFLRHAIHQSSMGQLITWSKFEENERWVRIIAEVWVTEFFPNIFNIKKIASRFSFLPFFKDLESGKALLNNNIFMGREETGSGPDFNFMNEFFSPMTGAELIFRIKSCARPDDFELLIQSAMGVARGSNSVQTFMSSVLNRRAHKDCTALMQEGLFPQDVVSESVRVDNLKDGITITREVDAIAYSKKFLVHADKPIERERIAVDFQDTDSVKRHLLPLPADEKKHSHTLAA